MNPYDIIMVAYLRGWTIRPISYLIQICGVPGNALQSATKPRERGGGMASKLGHCGDGWLGFLDWILWEYKHL